MRKYDICFHPGWWHKNAGIDFSQSFWDVPDVRMEADLHMRHELFQKFGKYGLGEKSPNIRPIFGSDLTACGYLFSEMLGCKIQYFANTSPRVVCADLEDDTCWKLTKPNFETNEVWQRAQSQLDDLYHRFGYVESHINLMGVQNIALDLRGQQIFMDYYEDEDLAHHVLSVACETLLEAGRRLRKYTNKLSGGVTNIVNLVCPKVFLTSNCSVEMVAEHIYEDFLLKYDVKLAEEFAPFGIHHCGQSMEHVINGYAKVPNLSFVEVGAFSDLQAVVEALPEETLINARYSPVRLLNVTEDELHRDLVEMMKIVPEERLSISCVGIDASTEDTQVEMFLACCKELLGE